MCVPKTSDHIQINIRMPNPSQEPPASSKAPNQIFRGTDCLCIFQNKIASQNSYHGWIKDQWPYPNPNQDAKPQSGTSSVLQSPKWRLKGHGCSLHLQNQDREPKFIIWVYQRLMTIFITISRCQTRVTKLQHPPKHQNQDLKDIDDLWTFKVKIGCQYLDYRFINDKWPYPNQGQDPKPQSGISNILRSPKSRVKG